MPDNQQKDYTYIGANTPIAQAALKATGQMISNTERGLTFSIQETAMRVLIS